MNKNYGFNRAPFHDDITKRVRIDVSDFVGKLDPKSSLIGLQLWKIILIGIR